VSAGCVGPLEMHLITDDGDLCFHCNLELSFLLKL
jgi:hypothetical protein